MGEEWKGREGKEAGAPQMTFLHDARGNLHITLFSRPIHGKSPTDAL